MNINFSIVVVAFFSLLLFMVTAGHPSERPQTSMAEPIVMQPVNDTLISTHLANVGDRDDAPFVYTADENKPGDEGGRTIKIAYIVDASGSMVDALPFVINEVKRQVDDLGPVHEATVLVFSGEGVYEVVGGERKKGMRQATDKFKQDINEWLPIDSENYETGGKGDKNAEIAILRALSYRPRMVVLISDTLISGTNTTKHKAAQDALMKSINKANKTERPAVFLTMQFINEDPLVSAGHTGTLQRLAKDTGGNYRFVSARDLDLK